jgi:hypothetical protein
MKREVGELRKQSANQNTTIIGLTRKGEEKVIMAKNLSTIMEEKPSSGCREKR